VLLVAVSPIVFTLSFERLTFNKRLTIIGVFSIVSQTVIASRVASFTPSSPTGNNPLTYAEAFHLATLGGAQVLGLGHACGNFQPGKQFDALLVDLAPPPAAAAAAAPAAAESPSSSSSSSPSPMLQRSVGPVDLFEGMDSASEMFQKFLYLGDDRNIASVFVDGRQVV
jgi:guanine deaminase